MTPADPAGSDAVARTPGALRRLGAWGSRLVDVPAELYPDPVAYWRARTLRVLVALAVFAMVVTFPFFGAGPALTAGLRDERVYTTLLSIVYGLVTFWLAGRGPRGATLAVALTLPGYLAGVAVAALRGNGILDPFVLGCMTAVIMAGLLRGATGALVIGGAASLLVTGLGWRSLARWSQLGPPILDREAQRNLTYALVNTVIFVTALVYLWDRLHQRLLRAAVETARAEQVARARQEALATFMGAVSHDMAGPLTIAKAYLQMAEGRLEKAGADASRLALVAPPLQRLEAMIKDLGAAARLESPSFSLDRRRCDLGALCRRTVTDHEVAAGRAIAIEVPAAPIFVDGDEARLGQVLDNLLLNACKHTPPQCPLTVTLSAVGAEAVLALRDEGPGIAAEHLPRLFQPFYRVPVAAPAGAQPAGLGLGLHICRELVERHGGRIAARSEPGRGTTFTVALPLAPAAPA